MNSLQSTKENAYSDPVLLLCASVNARKELQTSELDNRRSDYLNVFKYWLESDAFTQIVFIDNSGSDLTDFERAASEFKCKDVECISFNGNDFPLSYGKGYGESSIIKYALENSRLLSKATGFCKATGRILILNAPEILVALTSNPDFLCDVRDHNIYTLLRLRGCGHQCDVRFFYARKTYYEEHFLDLHLRGCEGEFSMEGSFFQIVKQLVGSRTGSVIDRFPTEPIYCGVAGHLNKNYSSCKERLKRSIRRGTRLLLPKLKI